LLLICFCRFCFFAFLWTCGWWFVVVVTCIHCCLRTCFSYNLFLLLPAHCLFSSNLFVHFGQRSLLLLMFFCELVGVCLHAQSNSKLVWLLVFVLLCLWYMTFSISEYMRFYETV
jgi:hypothetical protein